MGFLVTSLVFTAIGIIASLCARICCNNGPSANLFHLTLVITATVCCWLISLGRIAYCCRTIEQCVCDLELCYQYLRWAIVYLAQMNPLIVPILSEGE